MAWSFKVFFSFVTLFKQGCIITAIYQTIHHVEHQAERTLLMETSRTKSRKKLLSLSAVKDEASLNKVSNLNVELDEKKLYNAIFKKET